MSKKGSSTNKKGNNFTAGSGGEVGVSGSTDKEFGVIGSKPEVSKAKVLDKTKKVLSETNSFT